MNLWEKVTGNDMTKELKTFEYRAKKLPADYQAAWEKINAIKLQITKSKKECYLLLRKIYLQL